MALSFKACLALTVVWAAGVEGQADGTFWWLTNATTATTAATPTSTGIRCQCVPYYQCVNDVITTSGEGLIDIRFGGANPPEVNVETCSELINVCCKLPGDSNTTPAPATTTTLPPDTPCNCVPLLDCKDPNLLVSDGKGNTSLALFGTSFSHSKCQGAFEVCCASELPAQPQIEECVCVPDNLCGDDGYVVTDGAGIINIRVAGTSPAHKPLPSGACPTASEVCCRPPPTAPATTVAPSTTPPPVPDCGWRNVGGVRVSVFVVLVRWMLGLW